MGTITQFPRCDKCKFLSEDGNYCLTDYKIVGGYCNSFQPKETVGENNATT